MAAGTLIPVEEYLNTTYRPDRDYVEGVLLERNVGEQDHSWMQALIIGLFLSQRARWNVRPLPEQRVQVKQDRFRIPDVSVVRKGVNEQIITHPPVLCIEILSKDDTMAGMQDRIDDYLQFGVPTVWVLDPRTRRGFVYTADSMREAKDGILRAVNPGYPGIEVALSELSDSL